MTFAKFKKMAMISMEDICREIFNENPDSIRIKKEHLVVKNLMTIFNATIKLSNAKGFHAMSLRDLGRESGLSLGCLYNYFASKEELLTIIQDQGRRIVARLLDQSVDSAMHPKDKLEAVIRTHLYLSEVMQPWFFFSFMETRYFKKREYEKSIAGELKTEQRIIDILEAGRAQQVFNIDQPMLTASVTKAMLQDWYLKRWKFRRQKITVENYADFVIQFVDSAIM